HQEKEGIGQEERHLLPADVRQQQDLRVLLDLRRKTRQSERGEQPPLLRELIVNADLQRRTALVQTKRLPVVRLAKVPCVVGPIALPQVAHVGSLLLPLYAPRIPAFPPRPQGPRPVSPAQPEACFRRWPALPLAAGTAPP